VFHPLERTGVAQPVAVAHVTPGRLLTVSSPSTGGVLPAATGSETSSSSSSSAAAAAAAGPNNKQSGDVMLACRTPVSV